MAEQFVFLRYNFIFDAVDTYQHVSTFESDLAKFFREKGMEAKIVKTIEGQFDRIMLISKIDEVKEPTLGEERPKVNIVEKKEAPRQETKGGTYSKEDVKPQKRIRLVFKKGRRLSQKQAKARLGGK